MAREKLDGNASELQPKNFSELVCEMEGIKRLLMLLLAKLGSDSKEIAKASGAGDSTIRKIISFRQVKRICKYGNDKVE